MQKNQFKESTGRTTQNREKKNSKKCPVFESRNDLLAKATFILLSWLVRILESRFSLKTAFSLKCDIYLRYKALI